MKPTEPVIGAEAWKHELEGAFEVLPKTGILEALLEQWKCIDARLTQDADFNRFGTAAAPCHATP